MIKQATYNPGRSTPSVASSPHLYRPRSTSIHYPRRKTTLLQKLVALIPRRRPLRSYLTLTTLLLPIWLLILLHGEHWIHESTIAECSWENWERWPSGATPHRVALIADPQLVDAHTYARRGPALWATIFYTDLYMARTWETIHSTLAPNSVFFLGDLFDGGREWSVAPYHKKVEPVPEDPRGHGDWKKYKHNYWLKEFARFEKMFPTPAGTRSHRSLPGNHDLGFGAGVRTDVRDRFQAFFGKPNTLTEVGNHTFISIDSVSLANEADPLIYTPPVDFLASLEAQEHPLVPTPPRQLDHRIHSRTPQDTTAPTGRKNPTVLLTHVPLYRTADTTCGPLRERGESIPIVYGYQYQNVLPPALSSRVLAATKARWVFSGDDHDACDVVHHYGTSGLAREITVKSVSWAMGVRRPAVYLLSLWNPEGAEGETLQGKLCYEVDQIGVFIGYAFAALVSFVVCWVELVRRERRERRGLPVDAEGKYWKPGKGVKSWRWWGVEWASEAGRTCAGVGVIYALVMWWW